MHGMLPLHLGMRVRLLEHLALPHGLVKDAEGEVVQVVINPRDEREVLAAAAEHRPAYLKYLPHGVWLRMAKYSSGPVGAALAELSCAIPTSCAGQLVFVEAVTSAAFDFRGHKVTRTSLPLSHAMVQHKLQ